jgi:RimJ/RimL family protein N-acetyltransferase
MISLRSSEIRTSFSRGNEIAAALFEKLGFKPLPEAFEEEVILSYSPKKK